MLRLNSAQLNLLTEDARKVYYGCRFGENCFVADGMSRLWDLSYRVNSLYGTSQHAVTNGRIVAFIIHSGLLRLKT